MYDRMKVITNPNGIPIYKDCIPFALKIYSAITIMTKLITNHTKWRFLTINGSLLDIKKLFNGSTKWVCEIAAYT